MNGNEVFAGATRQLTGLPPPGRSSENRTMATALICLMEQPITVDNPQLLASNPYDFEII